MSTFIIYNKILLLIILHFNRFTYTYQFKFFNNYKLYLKVYIYIYFFYLSKTFNDVDNAVYEIRVLSWIYIGIYIIGIWYTQIVWN